MTISDDEQDQIEAANAVGLTPVVFVHGLWLLPSSWDRWAGVFADAGYAPVVLGWPADPDSDDDPRARPDVVPRTTVGHIADQAAAVIARLRRKPVVIGHSFGGLLAQVLAGRGRSAATVAIDPAPFRGVLPLPVSPPRPSVPARAPARRDRAVPLTYDQFRHAFANAVSEEEATQLYETFAVPACGAPVVQAATANLNPWTEATVDTDGPDRGPLLIISGERDHTVPWAVAHASFVQQRANPGVTEIVEMENRGHSLVIDAGWRGVAGVALSFVRQLAP